MYHENASTYTELLLRHCCALTVYSYWLVTCELQIEVWSCYYYKCLTVLLQVQFLQLHSLPPSIVKMGNCIKWAI